MPSTPSRAFPYPALSSAADVPADIGALALAVENSLNLTSTADGTIVGASGSAGAMLSLVDYGAAANAQRSRLFDRSGATVLRSHNDDLTVRKTGFSFDHVSGAIDFPNALTAAGALSVNSTGVGFFGVTPVARPGATADVKAALVSLGLLQGTSASPLNLNGGALTCGALTASGDLAHTGSKAGFMGAPAVVRPGATADIKAGLVSLGLLTGGGATPLDLNGGPLTAGIVIATTGAQMTGVQFSGTYTPPSGAGVEVAYSGGTGYMQSYDRGAAAFRSLQLKGSAVAVQVGATDRVVANATGLGFFGATPVAQPAFTLGPAYIQTHTLGSGESTLLRTLIYELSQLGIVSLS